LQGRSDECRERLERAVSVAAEAGFMRLFVEESPRLQALLLESPALKGEGTWQRSLRLMLQSQKNPNTASQKEKKPTPVSQDQNQGLAEPLSQRELEVLELINAGGANKDIAVRMGVAPATVKAHIRNLYGKLGVGRRTEALARARELGLLTQ